jgi:lipopolysaccharide/colanic/teichoic acid biosynthesis glycosyltransferase
MMLASRGRGLQRKCKRCIDVVVSALTLTIAFPLLAVIALLVRVKIGSPPIYRQTRPGVEGQTFTICKFRTMSDARDSAGQLLPDAERLTPFGALLRRTSIDELPELWNVFRGEMSLVGPRPLLVRYTAFFSEDERLRLKVCPGITGWAQVNGRNDASWDERLAHDVWYVRNWTLAMDVKILLITIARVLRRQGVVVDPSSTMLNLDDERRNRDPVG